MLPRQEVAEGRLVERRIGASYQWVILAVIWCSHTIYLLNYMAVGTLAPLTKIDACHHDSNKDVLNSKE
jgi:hypothetical protein